MKTNRSIRKLEEAGKHSEEHFLPFHNDVYRVQGMTTLVVMCDVRTLEEIISCT